jgi:putative ABC transport system permease protein
MRALTDIGQDVSQWGRSIRHAPGFFAACIITIALGIAFTTVLLSVVDAVLLRPLPFRDASRLVTLGSRDGQSILPGVPLETLETWRAPGSAFERAETWMQSETELGGNGMDPAVLRTTRTSNGMFEMLGARAQIGRVFTAADITGGAPPVVIVSDQFWHERMHADPSPVGRTLTLGGVVHTVIGVMPPGFTFHVLAPAIWVPLTAADVAKPGTLVEVVARLKVPLAAATAWADARAAQLTREQPAQKLWKIAITPLGGWRANPDVKRGLWVVLACAACVLLIGCANTANLMLVRNATRVRDIAIRSALGASRRRLARQLLVESLGLAIVAGALGIVLANWLLALVVPMIPSDVTFGSFHPIVIDPRVLFVTSVLSLGTGLVFGLVPALRGAAAGERLAAAAGRAHGGSRAATRLQSAGLAAQLGFAVLLLGGAALFGRSFVRLLQVDPGVDVAHLASVSFSLSRTRYPDSTARRQFYQRVEAAFRSIPGVDGVTRASGTPPHAGFSFRTEIQAQGQPVAANQPELVPFAFVDTSYFRTAGTRIIAGRALEAQDMVAVQPVAVVDEQFAHWLWGAASPVGRQYRMSETAPWITVIGVAHDAKLMGPDDREGQFEVYLPFKGAASYSTILLHTPGQPAALLTPMREAVRKIDPDQAVNQVTTMSSLFSDALAKPRFFLWLMMAFGVAALVLAAIGTYGTASFSARRRSRELAIRMAMGASEGNVLAFVMRQTGRVILIGLAAGLVATFALSRIVANLLFGVSASDPLALGTAVAMLGVTALVSSYLPALRVVRMEPFRALKTD